MRKYRLFFKSFKKEEDWINNIIRKGYRLVYVNSKLGIYNFIEDADASHLVRIDYRKFDNESEFMDYVTLFEDMGWKLIKNTKNDGVFYFELVSSEFDDKIFSDQDSRAGIYKRLYENYILVIEAYVPFFVALSIVYRKMPFEAIIHWKDYYYTPNLWEMDGWRFIACFLWETPFAFVRSFGGLVLYVILFALIILFLKSYILYRKEEV